MTYEEILHTNFVTLKITLDIGACYCRISMKKLCRCIITPRNEQHTTYAALVIGLIKLQR